MEPPLQIVPRLEQLMALAGTAGFCSCQLFLQWCICEQSACSRWGCALHMAPPGCTWASCYPAKAATATITPCLQKKEAMICSQLKAAVAEGHTRAAKPAVNRPTVIEVTKVQQIPIRYKGAAAEGTAPGAKDLSVVINCDSKLYDDTMAKCYR